MPQQQIVIVGAGIIGLSTAYALLKNGMQRVIVLEQEQVDHAHSTSRGLSRLLRFEYGADTFYSELVRLSLERWQEIERLARHTLYTRTGLLVLGQHNDGSTLPAHNVLCNLGLSTRVISRQFAATRFPQFSYGPYDTFTYTQEAGMLYASRCLHTLKELVVAMGGEVYEACRVTQWSASIRGSIRLHLNSDEELYADRVVLATGPWVHHLLGDLQLPIRLTRQYILYFSHVPASLFRLHTFPAFMADDLYGFPLHNTCAGHGPGWLKVASHDFGEEVEPGSTPVIKKNVIADVTERVCTLLPALREAELINIDTCMYDVCQDGDFILDYHPEDPRIVFATGLTGHGFKFGPLLGELLSSMVCATEPPASLERFKLARFGQVYSSQVPAV